MAHPVCGRIGDALVGAGPSAGMALKRGGTYLVMEGPQFSSLAESELYRAWKCDVIGMTNMPEAKLAREAEICYATVAMVTDYDCWHPGHDAVTVEMVIGVLLANAEKAKALIRSVVPVLANHSGPCRQGCQRALDQALITAPEQRDPQILAMGRGSTFPRLPERDEGLPSFCLNGLAGRPRPSGKQRRRIRRAKAEQPKPNV
jgi:5'-methylthioadenosine phosphorylase